MQRVIVRFSGRVQGVGFRATVLDVSGKLPVFGYVRNMQDGSVELLAEGESGHLQEFCAAIRQRLDRHIVSEDSSWSDIEESAYRNFSIAPSE